MSKSRILAFNQWPMKVHCALAIVSGFLTLFAAYAVTDTWDGGGGNNLIALDDH